MAKNSLLEPTLHLQRRGAKASKISSDHYLNVNGVTAIPPGLGLFGEAAPGNSGL